MKPMKKAMKKHMKSNMPKGGTQSPKGDLATLRQREAVKAGSPYGRSAKYVEPSKELPTRKRK